MQEQSEIISQGQKPDTGSPVYWSGTPQALKFNPRYNDCASLKDDVVQLLFIRHATHGV